MQWTKKGRLVKAPGYDWWKTHAQNPFPEHVKGDVYRIHFAGRDKNNRSQGAYVEIDLKKPEQFMKGKYLKMTKKPSLTLGDLGCFDDCGAMPSCIVKHGSKKYMYYTGWTQQMATPFSFFIGLAISEDGGKTYRRYSKAPVLGRNFYDPYLCCSPWVIKENGVWRMWYVSGTGWEERKRKDVTPKHYYHIKHAVSKDGIHWETSKNQCIYYKKDEYAIARPTLYKENGLYKMWYCYRGGPNTYRAGYAESKDGLKWMRKDKNVGLDVSKKGWDADMICYPCVFEHKGQKYMLYNGNRYGRTGCGLAVSYATRADLARAL